MKKPSIEPKKRIFAQCSLSFHPKIPLKHLYFAVFYGNIWQIKPKNRELPYTEHIRNQRDNLSIWQYGNSLAQKNIYIKQHARHT